MVITTASDSHLIQTGLRALINFCLARVKEAS